MNPLLKGKGSTYQHALWERIWRFLLGGLLGYLINLCLIRCLTEGFGSSLPGLGMAFPTASAIGISTLLVWGFLYSYLFNFRTQRGALSALPPYLLAMAISAITNYLTVNVLQWMFPWLLNLNVACGMATSGVVKFLLYHYCVFPASCKQD